MKYEISKIQGKFNTYVRLTALSGYCFYDADNDEKYYMTSIFTPITDEAELKRKYVAILGDAQKLNEELQNAYNDTTTLGN